MPGDLSVVVEIALVADDDDGEVIPVLDAQDLLLEGQDLLKALPGGDRVDEQKALAGPHVLFPHGRVLFLTGGIEDVEQGDFVVDDALFSVGICAG